MRIRTSGACRRIWRAASSPPPPGIVMSSTATSGWRATVSVTAAWPSPTSPTTSMPPSALRIRRTPSRMRVWSSARSTRIGGPGAIASCVSSAIRPLQRHPRLEAYALPRSRGHVEAPPQPEEPLPHPRETGARFPRLGGAGGIESASIVLYDDHDALRLHRDRGPDAARLGVPGDVRQRLLEDTIQRDLDLGRDVLGRLLRREVHDHPGASGELLRQRLDGGHEPEVVEGGGTEPADRRPDRLERSAGEVERAIECLAGRDVPLHLAGEESQLQPDRGQHLARLVVELPCDPPALGLLRAQQGDRGPAQLGAALLQRGVQLAVLERG